MNPTYITGAILGTAVGDALGLPYEGLSPHRAAKLLGEPVRMRFLLGRGMVSDDTEHTCAVAQSMVEAAGDVDVFRRRLARRLRWWLLGLPAGTGAATARACLNLWLGVSPERSGVFSAGNGPAMRAAVLGAAIDDLSQLQVFNRASTRITHSDPKAESGALIIALAAWFGRRRGKVEAGEFLNLARQQLAPHEEAGELTLLLQRAADSASRGETTPQFAGSLGLSRGVTGYVMHTVPVAIHAWLRYGDFRDAVTNVVKCGGDADSTAAIVGGLVGATLGADGIDSEWLAKLCEWPRSVTWMTRLGEQLARVMETGAVETARRLPALGVLPRNLFFLGVVLTHGLRRCLPPY